MSRKVYLKVQVKVVVEVDEGAEVSEVVDEMEYSFADTTGKATVLDTEIEDFEVTDSK